jgi:hypothetical protein
MSADPDGRSPMTFKVYAESLVECAVPWFTFRLIPLNGRSWCISVKALGQDDVSIPVTHPMAIQCLETLLAVMRDAA